MLHEGKIEMNLFVILRVLCGCSIFFAVIQLYTPAKLRHCRQVRFLA